MEYLIGTMLDAATIEAGRFAVEPGRCEADDLVRETAEVFGSLASSQRVLFEPVRPERGLAVLADRERVLQVLSNLLGNALKFTPADGRVRLSVERLDGEACFWVTDSGPGIAHEHMARIFDRYWKHESGGKRGTGLGLFIAKGIVEAHGGRIWVERPRDGGTRFGFTLPVAPSDEEREAAAQPSAPLP
jgi:signal transduction histidine kinase